MKPDIEPILTIAPDFAASMCLPKARQHQNVPLRFTSSTFSQCSSVTFSAGGLAAGDAGIVDQDVDAAVAGHHLVGDLRHPRADR